MNVNPVLHAVAMAGGVERLLSEDGVHFTEAGSRLLASAVSGAIRTCMGAVRRMRTSNLVSNLVPNLVPNPTPFDSGLGEEVRDKVREERLGWRFGTRLGIGFGRRCWAGEWQDGPVTIW